MKEDKLLNELFETARNEKPKVSFEEVADTFTKTVPATGLAASVKALLLNNINLNSIIAIIATGGILTALLFSFSLNPSDGQASENNSIAESQLNENLNPEPTNIPTTITKNINKEKIAFNNSSAIEEKELTIESDLKKENNTPIQQKTIVKKSSPEYEPISFKEKINEVAINETVKQEEVLQPKNDSETKVSEKEKIATSSTIERDQPKPKPATREMANSNYNEPFTGYGDNLKKLKRDLIGKLMNDGLIESKKDNIVIKIPEKEVVINGTKLSPYLYTKYTSTIQDYHIVPEDDRQIRISDDVILVGDFTDEGFKGKGVGNGGRIYKLDYTKEIKLGKQFIDIDAALNVKPISNLDNETEKIIQKALNIKALEKIFDKNEMEGILPLTLLTNNYFSENINLFVDGKKIKLIKKEVSLNSNSNLPIIFVTKYKQKKDKATFKFNYNNQTIFIQLKKVGLNWEYNKLNIKGNGTTYIDVKF